MSRRFAARRVGCTRARLHAAVGLRHFDWLDDDGGGPVFFQAELVGGLGRHVDDAILHVGAAIPDFDHLVVAVFQIRDPGLGAKRQSLARGGIGLRIHARTVGVVGSMAAEETHIVHQGILARHPHRSDGPAVYTACE